MNNTTVILIMLISTLGPSLVIGFVGKESIRALGRNPSASGKILAAMALAFVFAESIAIIALLVIFNLFAK